MNPQNQCDIQPATAEAIAEAAALLRAGRLVAFPTETVYGLGADATQDRAVTAIFEVKDRPRFNPLIVHFDSAEAARQDVDFDQRAEALAARFWPGPLTVVLPRRSESGVSLLCSAGLDSLAVRVPGHGVAQALLKSLARPIAAPSANRSGLLSPTRAEHVAESLGARVPLILDGGPCPVGLESTVLDLTREQPTLLRPGLVTREDIEGVIGPLGPHPFRSDRSESSQQRPLAPGQLESHYAPNLPLRLNADSVEADEALLAFGPDAPVGAAATLNLSEQGDLTEAAANFFAHLRALDRPEFKAIVVMPIPEAGVGRAINDRLRRGAAQS